MFNLGVGQQIGTGRIERRRVIHSLAKHRSGHAVRRYSKSQVAGLRWKAAISNRVRVLVRPRKILFVNQIEPVTRES